MANTPGEKRLENNDQADWRWIEPYAARTSQGHDTRNKKGFQNYKSLILLVLRPGWK